MRNQVLRIPDFSVNHPYQFPQLLALSTLPTVA
jgi:hypothetical protein